MNKKTLLIFSLAAMLGLSFSACQKREAPEGGPELSEAPAPKTVLLSEEALSLAGIEVATLEPRALPRKIKASGEVAFNSRTLANITARVAGRVEEVFVFSGDRVTGGALLLRLYSPEFLSSQAEFIQARERMKKLSADTSAEDRDAAASLLESARKKLEWLGLNETDFQELEASRAPKILLPVRAPFGGSIIESNIVPGDYIEMGSSLFRLANLQTLWVNVHIYEKDLAEVRQGCDAILKLAAFPEEEFRGKLTLLADVVAESTRTVKGRVEVANRSGRLRPGMYAEVDLLLPSEEKALFVPEGAVFEVEGKQVVFIPAGTRAFSAQEISARRRPGGFMEIVKGLKEGDRYVTEGGFLLKSELQKKSLEVD